MFYKNKRVSSRKLKTGQKNYDTFYDFVGCVDFECTCEKGKGNRNFVQEIIEFPIVLIKTATLEIVEEFHSYCKPVINPVLSMFCKNLTGITQEQVDNAPVFLDVLRNVHKWLADRKLGTENRFAFITDGHWDLGRFMQIQFAHLNESIPHDLRYWINFRKTFCQVKHMSQVSLKQMLAHVDLTFEGRQHCGLDDARNLARVVLKMMKQGAELRINERLLRRDRIPASSKTQRDKEIEHDRKRQERRRQAYEASSAAGTPMSGEYLYNVSRDKKYLLYKIVNVSKGEFVRSIYKNCSTCDEDDEHEDDESDEPSLERTTGERSHGNESTDSSSSVNDSGETIIMCGNSQPLRRVSSWIMRGGGGNYGNGRRTMPTTYRVGNNNCRMGGNYGFAVPSVAGGRRTPNSSSSRDFGYYGNGAASNGKEAAAVVNYNNRRRTPSSSSSYVNNGAVAFGGDNFGVGRYGNDVAANYRRRTPNSSSSYGVGNYGGNNGAYYDNNSQLNYGRRTRPKTSSSSRIENYVNGGMPPLPPGNGFGYYGNDATGNYGNRRAPSAATRGAGDQRRCRRPRYVRVGPVDRRLSYAAVVVNNCQMPQAMPSMPGHAANGGGGGGAARLLPPPPPPHEWMGSNRGRSFWRSGYNNPGRYSRMPHCQFSRGDLPPRFAAYFR